MEEPVITLWEQVLAINNGISSLDCWLSAYLGWSAWRRTHRVASVDGFIRDANLCSQSDVLLR